MAKKSKPVVVDVLPAEVVREFEGIQETSVELNSSPRALIEQIDAGNVALIPLPRLVPFYVQLDQLKKRIDELLKKSKETIIARRDQGSVIGDRQQHRHFSYMCPQGACDVTVQSKGGTKFNLEALEKLLKSKKLWAAATNLHVDTGSGAFHKFINKHRKELDLAGVRITEELDMDKVDGLCQAKLITPDEVQTLLEEVPPTHAVVAKLR